MIDATDPLISEFANELSAEKFALAAELEAAHRELDAQDIPLTDEFGAAYLLVDRVKQLATKADCMKLLADAAEVNEQLIELDLAASERRRARLEIELRLVRGTSGLARLVGRLFR